MNSVTKIPYDEYVRTTCMFMNNADYESKIESEIEYATDNLCSEMKGIFTKEGLERYIRENDDALTNLLNVMNISTEKFKRIITALRIEKGHTISAEWDISKIRNMMIERAAFMDEVCNLLMNGAHDEKYKGILPRFYLENFSIDSSTMARLSNPDDLRRLIKKGIEGKYNVGIGAEYYKEVYRRIDDVCFAEGVSFKAKKRIPLIGRVADFVIPDETHPKIIIDLSYNITTSSTQTKYKESEEHASKIIREYNLKNGTNIMLVNILDGAGWVARQSDLRAIYLCSAYTLHIDTICRLGTLIKNYC